MRNAKCEMINLLPHFQPLLSHRVWVAELAYKMSLLKVALTHEFC